MSTVNEKPKAAYSIASREQALDFMAGYPGYGEQRWYSDALGTEQVSFSWRRMPPATGGRGSYGHRHPGQEEVYFVITGTVTFKVGDDVFEAGPGDLVVKPRGVAHAFWNAGDEPARILEIISPAGFERFFAELLEPESADAPRAALAARYGLEIDLDSVAGLLEEHGLRFGPGE